MGPDSIADENRSKIHRWATELWSSGNLDAADELYAPRYTYQGVERTPADFKAGIAAWRSAFPDLVVTLISVLAEGDRIAWEWQVRGTNKAPFMGHKPTGRMFELTGVHVARFECGKIAEEREYFDEAQLLRQLD
ncbi:MAG: ester cyclase [Dehalococcoidia bacterium]